MVSWSTKMKDKLVTRSSCPYKVMPYNIGSLYYPFPNLFFMMLLYYEISLLLGIFSHLKNNNITANSIVVGHNLWSFFLFLDLHHT